MAFIPTAGAVRVDIQYTQQGQQIHNVIWVTREANWTGAERTALNNAIVAWWNTSAKQYFDADIALQQVTSVNQESDNAPSTTTVVSPVVPGTIGTPPTATNAALCATLRTDNRGRSYRGRMYLGGLPSASLSSAILWGTTTIANILTALSALKTAIEALGAIWVVVSHYTNKAPRAQGLKTPITAIAADQYVDSQRRRLGLRGV